MYAPVFSCREKRDGVFKHPPPPSWVRVKDTAAMRDCCWGGGGGDRLGCVKLTGLGGGGL